MEITSLEDQLLSGRPPDKDHMQPGQTTPASKVCVDTEKHNQGYNLCNAIRIIGNHQWELAEARRTTGSLDTPMDASLRSSCYFH